MEPHLSARHLYDQQLQDLEHDLLEMGSLAEAMVGQAVEALVRLDTALAMDTLVQDDEVDRRDIEIETRCIRLLALQQPMAGDLRVVGTAMKMITDIERVGDLACDIAKAALKIEKEMGSTDYIDVPKIAGVARAMFRESLEAYVRRDMDLVRVVCSRDDEVDDLYRLMRGQIHDKMRQSPDDVVSASWLLLAIHHIERIADHAVNVAERVAFMMTGTFQQLVPSHRPDSREA
ncbi:MAG TPA: phosphate signaling complex protein PhoU [Fimbriimonadaceae bacterium]|nr:phosphate signaling complex protein PhoU [Fimbriimonadaceae bacterium]